MLVSLVEVSGNENTVTSGGGVTSYICSLGFLYCRHDAFLSLRKF